MASSFIGGNLDSIAQVATRLDASGAKALETSGATDTAAQTLTGAVDDAMKQLVSRFSDIAAELNADILQSHNELSNSDRQGTSRDNAVQIKADLQTQVSGVLESATTSLNQERDAFNLRAQALLDNVQQEFGKVMTNVDAEYQNLAGASRQTRENLLAADQTIRLG